MHRVEKGQHWEGLTWGRVQNTCRERSGLLFPSPIIRRGETRERWRKRMRFHF